MLPIELKKWVQQGYCLAHHPESGQPIFVHGGLPGELVQIEILKERQKHNFGVFRSIVQASPERQPVDYEIFPECGGCSFRHIDYDKEIQLKLELLFEFRRLQRIIDQLDVQVFQAEPRGYRNQIQLQFQDQKPGFFKLHTNQHIALPAAGCRLITDQMNASIRRLDEADQQGRLVMREDKDRCFPVYETEYLSYHQEMTDGFVVEWQYNASSFWQTNRYLLPTWLQQIRDQVPDRPQHALELSCGTDIIAGVLADRLRSYTGIDNSKGSLAAARRNRKSLPGKTRLQAADLYARPCELPEADLLLINPPRAGLPRWLRGAFGQHPARAMLYSSCNPATLERDLEPLLNAGFLARSISIFDFFPRTPHLEVLLYLERVA